MADFNIAIEKTLRNEGEDKYTDRPNDRGGPTKYGISWRFLTSLAKDKKINNLGLTGISPSGLPTKETIKNLTLDQAKNIYKKYFWEENRYGEIEDQAIAEKVFDLSVLFGPYWVNKNIQFVLGLKQDGIIGPITLSFINRDADWWNGHLYKCFILSMVDRARYICNKDKTQDENLKGWLNRVMS